MTGLITGLLTMSSVAHADRTEVPTSIGAVKADTTASRMRIGFASGFTAISYEGVSLSGIGLGLGVQYALTEKWGLMGSFNQACYLSGFAPLYSAVDFRLVYALSGSLISRKERITLGSNEVLRSEEFQRGGFRATVQSDLYFFNSSTSVIPFTGLGLALGYEFPSSTRKNLNAGVRMDLVSSSNVILTPLQLFFGVLF